MEETKGRKHNWTEDEMLFLCQQMTGNNKQLDTGLNNYRFLRHSLTGG